MQIIFITGHRKSGTTLMGNLFDNNDFACVYPTDLTLMYAYYPYFNNNSITFKQKKNRIKKILLKSLSDKFCLQKINQKKFKIKDFVNVFINKINENKINNIKYLIKLLSKEYSKFVNQSNRKYFVIKETSSDIFYSTIFEKNEDIKFIHIIRDPRDNYASLKSGLKKYYSKIGEDQITLLSSMIQRGLLDFKFIKINQQYFKKKNYMVIKYENLILNVENVMKKICKYLNCKFSKKLLIPTILGKPATSNTFNKSKSTIINSKSISRWKSELNNIEKDIINFYFKEYLDRYYSLSKKNLKIDPKNIAIFYKEMNYKFFFNDSYK